MTDVCDVYTSLFVLLLTWHSMYVRSVTNKRPQIWFGKHPIYTFSCTRYGGTCTIYMTLFCATQTNEECIFCKHVLILWFYVAGYMGFVYVPYLFSPELYLCVALIYDGRENMSSLVWVAMINQGVKFILFDIIALWLVSWWSAKGKDDKMELYVVCSLICIMMIRQGVFSFCS